MDLHRSNSVQCTFPANSQIIYNVSTLTVARIYCNATVYYICVYILWLPPSSQTNWTNFFFLFSLLLNIRILRNFSLRCWVRNDYNNEVLFTLRLHLIRKPFNGEWEETISYSKGYFLRKILCPFVISSRMKIERFQLLCLMMKCKKKGKVML